GGAGVGSRPQRSFLKVPARIRVAHALLPFAAVRSIEVLAVSALLVAACSSGQLGEQPPGPGASPGTVTLRLLLPSGRSFCDVVDACSAPTHVVIGKEPGNWLNTGNYVGSACAPQCSSSCVALPCPKSIPIICAGAATGVAVTSVEATWDGSYTEWSTCGS